MNHLINYNQQSQSAPPKNSNFTESMYHLACGHGVESLLIRAMKSQSFDNVSVVMIGLKGFYKALEKAYLARHNKLPSS
jgi:hypothetical protein